MSSFNADKKREHEALAEKALAAGDYEKAFFHTAQAAEFTFTLAEMSDGDVAKAYLDDANGLVEIAASLKEKINEPERKTNKESSGIDSCADNGDEIQPIHKIESNIKLEDVKGLTEAKELVKKALIYPLKYPDRYKVYGISSGNGLLLYGPPGTGKTMFARAIAGELGLPFIYKKASELVSKYVGDSSKNVDAMFQEAYAYNQSVLFLDECDNLLDRCGNKKGNIVNAFITAFKGFEEHSDSRVFVLLATNRPWMVDPAVLSRVGAAVHVGLPEQETRKFIIGSALAGQPMADDVNIDKLVELTEGYSGRELAADGVGLCFKAKTNALSRWIERTESKNIENGDDLPEPIRFADFEKAMTEIKPTSRTNPDAVKLNKEWSLSNKGSAPLNDSSNDD